MATMETELPKVVSNTEWLEARKALLAKDLAGDIFHTYSTYARGCDILLGAYNYLDLTPLGRNETGANKDLTAWVRHHDKYEGLQEQHCCG